MKSILTKSALALISSLTLAACSTMQPQPQAASSATHTGQVYANYPHDPNDGVITSREEMAQAAAEFEADQAELTEQEKEEARRAEQLIDERRKLRESRVNLGIDDYQAVGGSMSPGQKSERQFEIEKVHRLAKLCIEAKNTSPPCLDIIQTNAMVGKLYIQQEARGFRPRG